MTWSIYMLSDPTLVMTRSFFPSLSVVAKLALRHSLLAVFSHLTVVLSPLTVAEMLPEREGEV